MQTEAMGVQSADCGLLEALKPFRCVRLLVEARATGRIQLPPYLGSTLRGAFGMALRQSCCVLRRQECATCLLRTRCIYSYTFETASNGHEGRGRRYASAPHPFVLDLSMVLGGNHEPDDPFSFNMTLIGRAADFLPYFVHAFQRMGTLGIGRGRGTFEVTGLAVLDARGHAVEKIFDGSELKLPEKFLGIEDALQAACGHSTDAVRLELLTPLRLVRDGERCREPSFPLLIGNLLRRLENLAYFHCDRKEALLYGSLLDQAQTVRLTRNDTRWFDWERYSHRQDRRMKLGGLIGEATYEGDLRPFLPILALGEWVNVGKGTSFGLGRYRILRPGKGYSSVDGIQGGNDDVLIG